MILGVGHVAFRVSDMEKSLGFYCGVLGLKQLFEIRKAETNEPWIVYLSLGDNQFLELFYGATETVKSDDTIIGYSHLCIEVDDINWISDKIKNAGLKLEAEAVQAQDFNWQCWVCDPDKNRIEMMQMSPESPQMKSKL